jgi:histidine triad (HIT) family protein
MNVFQKIIAGDIAAYRVYEDEHHLAFLDHAPRTRGHLLIVPKKNYPWFDTMPDDEALSLISVAKHMMSALKAHFPCDYVQLSIVGDEVPHTHIHLIPRNHGEKVSPAGLHLDANEMKLIQQQIQKCFDYL